MPSNRRGNVLIVDYDELVGRTMVRLLGAQHDVLVERDARAAVARILAGEAFDVVLCELSMPKLSGIQVYLEILRADREGATRVVFMSGSPLSDDMELFLQTSQAPLLEKPFSVERLRAIVNGLVQLKRPLTA